MKINFYSGFNNYYNRKVIVYDSLDDYQDYLLLTIPNVNFKPKDSINTEQIVNTTQVVDYQLFNLSNTPDYAIVADDDNTIISRWFVTQYESLIYKNQYRAVLRRDVIADNYDAVIEAPVFIEKATITDKTDPAIFNSENMGFNQIKTSETLLKDLSNISWLVGYVPSDFDLNNDIEFEFHGTTYTVFAPSNAMIADNMPFKVFALPFEDINCYQAQTIGGETTIYETTLSKDLAAVFATTLSASIGSGKVFDVQVLPYCPLRLADGSCVFTPDVSGEYLGKYEIPLTNYIPGTLFNFDYIHKKTDANQFTNCKQLIFWNVNNKFTFDITYTIPLPDKAEDMKVKNECDMWRLCSPNFQGQFEFNAMKNGGVTKFNVDCLYQPFSPYIHINPDFGSLYGEDFNDARGLICSGDYSLPQETNAWTNYVQNNKNYQASFDRQIQNMETMNKYQMISQGVSAGVGALQGAGTGAFIGGGLGLAGGPIGAVAGGLASAYGGILDTIMLANQQKETLDYTKDQFNFNMQNIKAMPNSISKTNPITNNNKIFPVLEYYTCKDIEKQALKDKLEYNGMTIGRIGKIKDWLLTTESYIKGKLIMLDSSIEEDYHTVVEIAQELDKGIRAKKEE